MSTTTTSTGTRREQGGGGGGDLVQLSKKLSYLLRHGAVKAGLNINKEGFVSMEEMVKHTRATEENIMEVVTSNDKQRFAVKNIEGKQYIRANQGHSIQVEDLDLKKVASSTEIPTVVHGTYLKSWGVIKKEGLSKMGRNHIHFASGHFTDSTVISGMRKTAEILIYVNAEKAMKDGIEFLLSANGVILTSGNERGYLEPKYFAKAVNSKGVDLITYTTSSASSTPSASSASSSTFSSTTSSSPTPIPRDPNDPAKKQKTRRSKRKSKKNSASTVDNTENKIVDAYFFSLFPLSFFFFLTTFPCAVASLSCSVAAMCSCVPRFFFEFG